MPAELATRAALRLRSPGTFVASPLDRGYRDCQRRLPRSGRAPSPGLKVWQLPPGWSRTSWIAEAFLGMRVAPHAHRQAAGVWPREVRQTLEPGKAAAHHCRAGRQGDPQPALRPFLIALIAAQSSSPSQPCLDRAVTRPRPANASTLLRICPDASQLAGLARGRCSSSAAKRAMRPIRPGGATAGALPVRSQDPSAVRQVSARTRARPRRDPPPSG